MGTPPPPTEMDFLLPASKHIPVVTGLMSNAWADTVCTQVMITIEQGKSWSPGDTPGPFQGHCPASQAEPLPQGLYYLAGAAITKTTDWGTQTVAIYCHTVLKARSLRSPCRSAGLVPSGGGEGGCCRPLPSVQGLLATFGVPWLADLCLYQHVVSLCACLCPDLPFL